MFMVRIYIGRILAYHYYTMYMYRQHVQQFQVFQTEKSASSLKRSLPFISRFSLLWEIVVCVCVCLCVCGGEASLAGKHCFLQWPRKTRRDVKEGLRFS